MERSGFFNANLVGDEYDRVYLAEQFAAYFSSFIGNGVFGGHSSELQVTAKSTPSMQVEIQSGKGYIGGYWYENSESLTLDVDFPDGSLGRIDSVVLRLDYTGREIKAIVKKGTPATSPIAPSLTRDADFYELQLAILNVSASAIDIKPINIIDTRLNADVCGTVVGLIQQIDATTFGNQLQGFIDDYVQRANDDYLIYEGEVQDLLNQLEGLIDESTLVTIVSRISVLETDFITHKNATNPHSDSLPKSGGTMTGDLKIEKELPHITLDNVNSQDVDQAFMYKRPYNGNNDVSGFMFGDETPEGTAGIILDGTKTGWEKFCITNNGTDRDPIYTRAHPPYVSGAYTGNGEGNKFINLGFQPSAVIVSPMYDLYQTPSTTVAAFYPGKQIFNADKTNVADSITLNISGFRAYNSDRQPYQMNILNREYKYIAFK